METALINLKILLPYRVFAEKQSVTRMVVETRNGSFGLLPHRLDCAATLSPGILVYQTPEEGEAYVAVDEGVLVKTGAKVVISVRNAVGGRNLGKLRAAAAEILAFTLSLFAGLVFGTAFFGGLWWTVSHGAASKRPALLFVTSFFFRAAFAVSGLYAVGHAHLLRLGASLLGFFAARSLLLRLTRPPAKQKHDKKNDLCI
jgi:F-type H+-transporting ATPase subunit epsilon